ncbi:hypothetical protein JK386_13515 [Nocardioides sp. zg-536]|uniref:Uncharacterized protein n=1 Tax=Nocardioides faecalis TaxID=2803858 RepID=A0A939BWR5_9ACTN|nr:hypothetical protein [Nocardioides faecalis]MBM9460917.1 hypothetical protein [Nocardioides faecalis]QVI59258.1 hypothetical protein KG111_02450 [Nocardioides faecalis]
MFAEPLPEHVQTRLHAFEEALVDLRTRRVRLEAIELPDAPGPDPADLARAAGRPDAPPELRAVGRAVAEGRASWDDVLAGRVDAAPEVGALFAASRERFAELWERGRAEDERLEDERRESGSHDAGTGRTEGDGRG